jgi:hypothetical protein
MPDNREYFVQELVPELRGAVRTLVRDWDGRMHNRGKLYYDDALVEFNVDLPSRNGGGYTTLKIMLRYGATFGLDANGYNVFIFGENQNDPFEGKGGLTGDYRKDVDDVLSELSRGFSKFAVSPTTATINADFEDAIPGTSQDDLIHTKKQYQMAKKIIGDIKWAEQPHSLSEELDYPVTTVKSFLRKLRDEDVLELRVIVDDGIEYIAVDPDTNAYMLRPSKNWSTFAKEFKNKEV